jgi:SAM-dependent methyltransferase
MFAHSTDAAETRRARAVNYDPLLYSLVHVGTPGDIAFYLERTQPGEHVLELGVGYGRVMSALAAKGRYVTGVDLHPGLLALAARHMADLPEATRARTQLLQGDMTKLDLTIPAGASFDCVIIPYTGLWCLLDDDAVLACLNDARRRLKPGGRLLLDAYAGDSFHDECIPQDQDDEQLDEVAVIVAGNKGYDVYEKSSWDRARQRLLATYVYAATDGSEQHSFQIDQRYLLRQQLEALVERSGLVLHAVWGDFEGCPYSESSEIIALEARVR